MAFLKTPLQLHLKIHIHLMLLEPELKLCLGQTQTEPTRRGFSFLHPLQNPPAPTGTNVLKPARSLQAVSLGKHQAINPLPRWNPLALQPQSVFPSFILDSEFHSRHHMSLLQVWSLSSVDQQGEQCKHSLGGYNTIPLQRYTHHSSTLLPSHPPCDLIYPESHT